MTSIETKKTPAIQYPSKTVLRAERALRCSAFNLALFAAMRDASVPLQQITQKTGTQKGYTKRPLSERRTESDLLWLINVGLLRREVDGQGITDSFRLTPLGRHLVEKWEGLGGNWHAATLWERGYNALNRWLKLSI